ncbi:MAG: hydroxyacid dehydrogenase [Flavobacteriales bacterium]|nr:hydroxyacid dehydrogenase [Flavobacteriales bacterium]
MKPKVIFIDSVHPILFERLEKSGYECHWRQELSRDEVLSILPNYQGAVIRSKFKFDAAVFEKSTHLKWIARSGAGMENIDHILAAQKNIQLFNSPEGNRDAVAEHCLTTILGLFNHLKRSDTEVRNAEWNREKNRGLELKGKTVGLLGYGFMGQAFAERLIGFGVNTIAYDKYKTDYSSDIVQEVSLKQLQRQVDILSIHLPLTEETQFMVNAEFIQQFKKSFYLINTARGKNVETQALVDALKSGKVKGACLDVLEYEKTSFEALKQEDLPEVFQYLSRSDKVILTPHVAGWTQESYFKLSDVLADKILTKSKPISF